MNNFDKLALESNELAFNYLSKYYKNKSGVSITTIIDKYSYDDILVNDNGILISIEVKLRNRLYDYIVMEKTKVDNLIKKKEKYNYDNIWYMNIFNDTNSDIKMLIFDIDKILSDFDDRSDELLIFADTLNLNKTTLCKFRMNKYKAINSDKIEKLTYLVPITKSKIKYTKKGVD